MTGAPHDTILVIDDELQIRNSLKEYLEDHEYVVLQAGNGREGLALALERRPDLVLVDLCMPVMSGQEFIVELVRQAPEIPIIVVSGVGDIDDAMRAVRLGAWDFVTKPVAKMPLLLHTIQSALERARLRRESVQHKLQLEREVHKRTRELEQTRAALAEQNGFLSTLLRSLPNPIFYKDAAGRYLGCNAPFAALVGLPVEDILGRTAEEIIPLERVPDIVRTDQEVLLSGGTVSYTFSLAASDGSTRSFQASKGAFLDVHGAVAGVVGGLVDVTELKRTQRELRAAYDRAEAANKAKGEFLANMSHEIRTPLNGVMGMLQLIQMSCADPALANYSGKALDAGRRLLSLMNDILDFSRIEAGKLSLSEEPFRLGEVVDSVTTALDTVAREKGLTLGFGLDWSVPEWLVGDGARIRQILFNLVGNAVKFTERGQVTIEAWARANQTWDDPQRAGEHQALPGGGTEGHAPVPRSRGPMLYLTVSDTGPGIPDEKLDIIFERFTQAEGSYTRQHQGAGLGLAIVRRIVQLMGGGICVESRLGRGSRIHVHLPLRASAASGNLAVAEHGQVHGVVHDPVTLPPLRVLVAEDELISQLAVRVMLERLGHRVTVVGDGQAALEALRAEAYDCVLMDVQMPVLDGVAATRLIRAEAGLGERASTPIVALTAYAMTGDRERFLAAGMDDYVVKPMQMEELRGALERVVQRKSEGKSEGESEGKNGRGARGGR